MKVLFLDIDGVLNSVSHLQAEKTAGRRPRALCAKAVRNLNRVLRATDARIVVSSAWRIGRSVAELSEILESHGAIPGRVLGKTPWLPGDERGREIAAWLSENGDGVKRFVIVDDDVDDILPRFPGRTVKTDFRFGLTRAKAALLLGLLS